MDMCKLLHLHGEMSPGNRFGQNNGGSETDPPPEECRSHRYKEGSPRGDQRIAADCLSGKFQKADGIR